MASVLELIARAVVPDITAGVAEALPTISGLAALGTRFSGPALAASALGGVPKPQPVLSANEIIRQVRSMGFKVRRQAALRTIKLIRTQQAAMESIAKLTPGQRPLMRNVPLAHTRQRLKYAVKVQVTGHNRLTGENQVQIITINSPRLISPSQAYAAAADAITTGEEYQMVELQGFSIIGYTRQNLNVE